MPVLTEMGGKRKKSFVMTRRENSMDSMDLRRKDVKARWWTVKREEHRVSDKFENHCPHMIG